MLDPALSEPVAGESVHLFLRRSTAEWHRAVDAAFGRFDLATADGLRRFLLAQARSVLPLERELEDRGVARLLPDWMQRRRSAALAADLHALGAKEPESEAISLQTNEHLLGTLYVLEGSRLGAKFLRRLVVGSADPGVREALQFLDHTAGPRSWPVFLEVLNGVPLEPENAQRLREAATSTFSLFHRAACAAAALVVDHDGAAGSEPVNSTGECDAVQGRRSAVGFVG